MARCDIIIPYFQRKSGVLDRALRSVANQTFTDYRILIVDDGSPFPPEAAIESLAPAVRDKSEIIRKPNGGVSSARNAGLAAVSADAAMVAFLDSDDTWTPDHLARAQAAILEAGVDMFWDAITPDAAFGSFRSPSAMIPAALRFPDPGVAEGHVVTNLLKVMCGQWFRHMHLSCTVLSTRLASRVRFRQDLSVAEDFEFFCQCAEKAESGAVSDRPGVQRGEGDNLWHGVGFYDPRSAKEKLTTMKLFKQLRRSKGLDAADRDLLDLRIQICREEFCWIEKRLFQGGKASPGLWADWLASDPAILGGVLTLALKTSANGGKTVVPGDDF